MCGEEPPGTRDDGPATEIPPRVRRRVPTIPASHACAGNTSACAEKSLEVGAGNRLSWKYLRVCGEESASQSRQYAATEIPPRLRTMSMTVFSGDSEIPPRVRRRVGMEASARHYPGNTSACAEKRLRRLTSWCVTGKYLRVCGEETRSPAMISKEIVVFGFGSR